MERKITITAYKSKSQKLEQVRNMLGEIAGVHDGTTYIYQGMTLERYSRHASSRQRPLLEVYNPDGEQVLTLQPSEHSSHEIVEILDNERLRWAQQGIKSSA
jgi:hypothetical protein